VLAAISVGVLAALGSWVAVGVVAAVYLGMLVVRFAVGPGRVRLGLLAGGMIAIAAVALLAVLVDAAGAAVPAA
jgi:hypothetical protein